MIEDLEGIPQRPPEHRFDLEMLILQIETGDMNGALIDTQALVLSLGDGEVEPLTGEPGGAPDVPYRRQGPEIVNGEA